MQIRSWYVSNLMNTRIILSFIAVTALFGASAAAALASPMSDGNAAYKAKDYNTALTDYQQAVAQTSGADQAKAYYKEGLTYHHLNQNDKALAAYNQAKADDPSLSFASSADKFNQMVSDAGGSSAATGAPAQTSGTFNTATTTSNSAPSSDPVAVALASQSVYVAPQLANQVSATALQQAAASKDDILPIKIAVLDRVPSGYNGTVAYAEALHTYLNLGKGGLIVVAAHGHGAGVADISSSLTQAQERQLAQKYVAQIGSSDYVGGITNLANDLANTAYTANHAVSDMLWIIFLVVVVIISAMIIFAGQRKKVQIGQMRGPLEAEKGNVLAGIEYIDNYIDVLPKNNADSDQVRAFRQAAAAKLDQASKIMVRSTELSDLNRAQYLLDQAQTDVQNGRRYLDRATGGTGNIPGDSAVRPVPLPATQQQVQSVAPEQRGVSFFSSRPAPIGGLVPVTLTVDGQSKTVMATPEEADMVRRGQIPAIRSFNVGGQPIPWYAYQSYDPYNDYWTYQNNGWRGVAGGAIAGFIGAELLNDIFAPRPYWGGGWYSPYAYGPGWDSYGGWNDYGWNGGGWNNGWGGGGWGAENAYDQGLMQGERDQQMNDYAMQDQYTQPSYDPNASAGASFMGGGGSGYDTSDYGNSGGGSGFMGGDGS